jgi:uncharacterized sulfatase
VRIFHPTLVSLLLAVSAAAAERPNIVFIVTDDQAPWALGCAGHPDARTPNMDRLFREGAYLVNAFCVTPVCSPSRASIVASRYGSELGVTDWINPRNEPDHGLAREHLVWPEVLAAAGYRTGLIGKWHLGTLDRFHPTQSGYEYFMGFRGGGNKPVDPLLEVDGAEKQLSGVLADILTDDAIEFVRQRKDTPFVLSLHFREPHAPWLPMADEDWKPFEHLDPKIPNPDYPRLDVKRVKRVTREYLASVASVDRNLGRLLDELDQLGIPDDTIVICTSDHGYNMGHNGIWHKGNGHWILTEPVPGTANIPENQRPNMYDNSLRVPAAVRWPRVIAPGTVVTRTVTHLDWYPTLLAMAGAELPAGSVIRGRNILPLLEGGEVEWDDDMYAEYSTHHQSRTHMRAYRTPQWKLVRDFLNPGRDELYDLQHDPAETMNLIASENPQVQHIRAELSEKILARMRDLGGPVLESTPSGAQP